jgi:predicted PurR-regulated permease PerM
MQTHRIQVDPKSILIVIAVVAAGAVLVELAPVILVLVVALFLVGTLGPGVEWLQKRGLGRGWAIAIVCLSALGGAFLIGALTLPSLFDQVPRRFHLRLSRTLINLETIVGGYIRGQAVTSGLMAVFTFGLLVACGVPNPLALAAFAGVADVLPYVGAALAIAPAVAATGAHGVAGRVHRYDGATRARRAGRAGVQHARCGQARREGGGDRDGDRLRAAAPGGRARGGDRRTDDRRAHP